MDTVAKVGDSNASTLILVRTRKQDTAAVRSACKTNTHHPVHLEPFFVRSGENHVEGKSEPYIIWILRKLCWVYIMQSTQCLLIYRTLTSKQKMTSPGQSEGFSEMISALNFMLLGRWCVRPDRFLVHFRHRCKRGAGAHQAIQEQFIKQNRRR